MHNSLIIQLTSNSAHTSQNQIQSQEPGLEHPGVLQHQNQPAAPPGYPPSPTASDTPSAQSAHIRTCTSIKGNFQISLIGLNHPDYFIVQINH